MAGSYVDYPSWRMALDKDGTIGLNIWPDSTVHQLSSTEMQYINSENQEDYVSTNATGAANPKFVYLFPELRDIAAMYLAGGSTYPYNKTPDVLVETSTNTTNGIDGTWTSRMTLDLTQYSVPDPDGGLYVTEPTVKPEYRTKVRSLSATSCRGIRITPDLFLPDGMWRLHEWHIFGSISSGQNPDRLVLWHPTLNQRCGPAHFDWGNVPRSSSADKTFRVKNNSATLTANDITVAMDTPTDSLTVSVASQHSLSEDGVDFFATLDIGSLAPGDISPVLTIRRVTAANADLSLWTFRIYSEADSWS